MIVNYLALLRGNAFCKCRELLLSSSPAGSEAIMTSGRLWEHTPWKPKVEGQAAWSFISRPPYYNPAFSPTTMSAPSMVFCPLIYKSRSEPWFWLGSHNRSSSVPSDNSQSTRPTGGTKPKGLCGDTTHILLEMKIYFYVLKACDRF